VIIPDAVGLLLRLAQAVVLDLLSLE